MPFNGSGTYTFPSLPGSFNPAISGQAATPGDWNTLAADLTANGLTNTICKDGQTIVTADIPFANFRLKLVGNATALTDAPNMGQVQNGAGNYAVDTGIADAYLIAPTPAISAYAVGQAFRFKAIHANATTTPTLGVSGLTVGIISWSDGSGLVAGTIAANALLTVIVASVTTGTPTFHLQTGLPAPTTTTTQAQADNSTKLANTAYVDRVAVQQVAYTKVSSVATGNTAVPYDDTIPQNNEGDQYMTLAITPKSATSKLVIQVKLYASSNATDNPITALFQDSTAGSLAAVVSRADAANGMYLAAIDFEMVSGTTSATTFKVRSGSSSLVGGTITFNGITGTSRLLGGVFASSITITEIGV